MCSWLVLWPPQSHGNAELRSRPSIRQAHDNINGLSRLWTAHNKMRFILGETYKLVYLRKNISSIHIQPERDEECITGKRKGSGRNVTRVSLFYTAWPQEKEKTPDETPTNKCLLVLRTVHFCLI